ncbi:MAG TPA: TIGR02281 family clan AA aspartic protease [Stellaceae bacterium]|nr:TIGR02281 family clan AA aspartic protease [Stellaceae bacterium]
MTALRSRDLDEPDQAEDGATSRHRPGGGMLQSTLIIVGSFVALALALGLASRLALPTLLGAAGLAGISRPASSGGALAARPVPNRLVYRADAHGHFLIDASINGAPIRFLLDTGASMVALSPEDARAVGIAPGDLRFSETMNTANGVARAAPVRLRSLRLGQFEVTEVPAVVMEQSMPVSLLGMSFLDRLSGYSIRDRVLTIDW